MVGSGAGERNHRGPRQHSARSDLQLATGSKFKTSIGQFNTWLRAYATQSHVQFIDYYTALAGPTGEFRADLSNDGVHPNRSGYRLMRGLVQKDLRPR